jgi:cytochrome P450
MNGVGENVVSAGEGLPALPDYDPLDPAQNADPFPLLARARREEPVFYASKYDLWIVTRRDDALKIYRDPKRFSNVGRHEMLNPLPDALRHRVSDDYVFAILRGQLAMIDPPQHTRIRKLMLKAFTPRVVREREGEIREIAHGLIDRFIEHGSVEIMAAYASPIPVTVIARILGIPDEHTGEFRVWADDFFILRGAMGLSEEEQIERWSRLLDEENFVRAYIAERRADPQEDLTSRMILARSDDGSPSLTDDELLANIFGLVLAGTDTTAILIGHAIYALLYHDGQWERVTGGEEGSDFLENVVDETMRWRGPLRGGIRIVKEQVEVGAITLQAGTKVFLSQSSIDRDEDHYDDPDSFDLDRSNSGDHLGLGFGIHYCLGAALAELEARIALECLAERVPGLRLADSQGPLEYTSSMILPSLRSVDVVWD